MRTEQLWQGTPLADASGEISNVERDVRERNLAGGNIELASEGDVIVADGAILDVSGGAINYTGGDTTTSRLLGANGQLYDISDADPDRVYVAVADAYVVEHPKWGVTEVFQGYPADISGNFEAGYIEGKDAGAVSIIAPNFVLDGQLIATTERGRYQRAAPTVVPEGVLYRPFDEVPLGGALNIGSPAGLGAVPNYVTSRVAFAPGKVLPDLTEALGRAFDPFADSLGAEYTSRINPALVGPGRVARLAVFANDRIELAEDVAIDAPSGSSIALTAGQVALDGSFRAPGGAVDIAAEVTAGRFEDIGISVGAAASVDVSGVWVNDNPLLDQPEALLPFFIDGGRVTLQSQDGDLLLAEGSRIDVSGGAYRDTDGVLTAGRGGLVQLAAEPGDQATPVEAVYNAELSGFALFDGATLDLAAGSICIAAANCADDPNEVWVTPDLYLSRGFADVTVTANLIGLELAAGTQVVAQQRNFALPDAFALRPSTSSLASFARIATLPQIERRPVSITLATDVSVPVAPDLSNINSPAILLLGEGSRIDADPGASISLTSTSRIEHYGSITAPGGDVSMAALRGGLPPQTGVRGVRLGDASSIDVSGTALIRLDALGRRTGEVLDGGSIDLRANLGSVVVAPDARLALDGSAAELDIETGSALNPVFEARNIGSNGGRLTVTAAESILLGGRITAAGGAAEGTAGGSLAVSLDGNLRGGDPSGATGNPTFSLNSRQIVLSQSNAPIALPGDIEVPERFSGQALVSATSIEDAGFADLDLSASSLFGLRLGTTFLASLGEIVFDGPVNLTMPGSLRLNAANITGGSGSVSLGGNYVAIGHEDSRTQDIGDAQTITLGELAINANLVDLVGNARVRGFETLNLASNSDLRLIGEQFQNTRELRGSLVTDADVDLSAVQIYPTTLTDYRLIVEGDEGRVAIAADAAGAQPLPVLSAAGNLTIAATTIEQGGRLRAPFGGIQLNATNLSFTDGSVTSTSLDGAVVPFGSLQGGFDWTYELGFNQTLVFDGQLDTLPQQQISLNADAIDIGDGALIDVSASGDLLAYEFIPGLGGSRDFLSADVSPNTFAILPGSDIQFAPYDPAESPGVGFQVGDAVFLEGVGDLQSGTYTLLPARYALLPGAVLVTAVEGYADILADQRFLQLDGSVIVAGRRVRAGTDFAAGRTTGFALRPGTDALIEAEYQQALATSFFAGGSARTPADAGVLTLNAGSALGIRGRLDSSTSGGRGAEVSIVADDLRVVGAISGGTDQVELTGSDLQNLAAESIVLGGVRRPTADGQVLDVLATRISVDPDIQLSAPELILTAIDSVSLGDRSRVSGAGATSEPEDLTIDGDGAFLRVSGGDQLNLERNNATGLSGDIRVGVDAEVAGAGSVALDASRDIQSAGQLSVDGGALRLGASAIALGETDENVAGLLLGSDQLEGIDASELTLASRSAIEVYGNPTLSVSDELIVEAPGLVAADDLASLTLEAPNILVRGDGSNAMPGVSSNGSLQLIAERLTLSNGDFAVDGFTAAVFGASEFFAVDGVGSLTTLGDLSIDTPTALVAAGADYRLNAAGTLDLSASGGVQTEVSGGLGGRFDVSGSQLTIDTRISAPSGIVNVAASDTSQSAVRFGSNADVDVRGQVLTFDDRLIGTPGGSVAASATNGGIVLDNAAVVRADAGGAADAGQIRFQAPTGVLDIRGTLSASATDGTGGELLADAERFSALPTLFRIARNGGFTGALAVRQRGAGELIVAAGDRLSASTIRLENDGGAISIDGRLGTLTGTPGRIEVFAQDDIDVTGTVTLAAGGEARFESRQGAFRGAAGSTLDLGGGDFVVQVDRAQVDSLLDADTNNDGVAIESELRDVGKFDLIADHRFVDDDGQLVAAEVSASSANERFAALESLPDAASIAAALGLSTGALPQDGFRLRPGLTIEAAGDLALSTDWDLSAWRINDTAGLLTLVATQNLAFDASLSDGFASANSAALIDAPDSWSYRLSAGADLAAANPLQVIADNLAGSVSIAPGVLASGRRAGQAVAIRTGTGDIRLSAAGDLIFGNQASVIYTAGTDAGGVRLTQRGDLSNIPYLDEGGDIRIDVGRDVIGAPSDQLFTSWLWRTGRGEDTSRPNATGWTANPARFEQGIAALGGGNVEVSAGRDLLDVAVSIPSTGKQVGGTDAADSVVETVAGGDLKLYAGRDLRGGTFLVGLGSGAVNVDGAFGTSETTGLPPIVGIGDASVAIMARNDLRLQTAVTPTLIPQSAAQQVPISSRSYFSTYAPTSSLSLTSLAGDLSIADSVGASADALNDRFEQLLLGPDALALQVLPPTLRATALTGSVDVEGSVTLFPAPGGTLELMAGSDITLGTRNDSVQIILSDVDPEILPIVSSPDTTLAGLTTTILTNPSTILPQFNAADPVHLQDSEPARIVARNGTVRMLSPSLFNRPLLWLAKSARVFAGTDIENLSLTAQNLSPDAVTRLEAGRDIIFPNERTPDGALALSNRAIDISGTGLLRLVAGRDIDLQTAAGITSLGNLQNPALPDTGAAISLLAGIAERAPNYDGFRDVYLVGRDDYLLDLIGYLESLGIEPVRPLGPLDVFDTLDPALQQAFLDQIFFAELRTSGREAAEAGDLNGDFTRGFTALETLFPGANPDIDAGEANAYDGDISLFFSRVYTLDGGDIRFLVPGGLINAGLATPPVAFGLGKAPEQLGVVAQRSGDVQGFSFGDFAVNESRVFAADGGDILIWATRGDIDAGRGAKTAISAPPPQVLIDPETGATELLFPAALTGSGIQTLRNQCRCRTRQCRFVCAARGCQRR